ncbi:MAG: thermonuclease family protein [Firmicutes bacterium]|nr:thermonuclease family protein [Bacillota bacterium]
MAVIVIAGFYGYVIPMTRAGEPSALEGPYPVVSVTDGDTFACEIDGEKQKVRLIGVDCPESVHPDASKNSAAGEEASAYTKDLLTEKKVWLEFDTEEKDRYGRLLCYVYLDGEGKTMVQELLLSDGMAQVSTYPPNVKYEDRFLKLQRKARSEKKGFWAESAFE